MILLKRPEHGRGDLLRPAGPADLRHDAGVVERGVEPAELGDNPPDQCLYLGVVAHVVPDGERLDADVEGDFVGLTGLDDDTEVVNAELSVFGLDDEAIKIG